VNSAQIQLHELHEMLGSWRSVGDHLDVDWWNCYDLFHKPSSMTRQRKRQVLDALDIETTRYYRPCLSPSTKQEVADMLEQHPGYTITDIINCGIQHFEDELT